VLLPQASVIWFAIHSAVLFHHRPADPKPVEPTHCQVGLPLALQAPQGLLIRAHRPYTHWKPRIEDGLGRLSAVKAPKLGYLGNNRQIKEAQIPPMIM
jgi:hypothetical protein